MTRIVVAVAVLGWLSLSRSLGEVEYRLVEVADSGSYLVYSYVLQNPTSSTWGLSAAIMDISASSGTPASLPATGPFLDIVANMGGATPHAEVGPISPAGWGAIMDTRSGLLWSPPGSLTTTSDSIAPGDSLGGFGLRSTYLPGLRRMQYEPTAESCCQEPIATTPEIFWALPRDYTVEGWSAGPRYMPSEVTIELLQEQAEAVCTDPLWITDEELCEEIADSLALTAARFAVANYAGARQAVLHSGQLLPPHHDPGPVHDNAYWMLGANAAQLYLYNFPHDPLSELSLCAGGPASTDVIFDLDPAGGDLLVGTPLHVDAEQVGVDPLGSSCQAVWRFPLDGTSLEHVTVRVDSVTAGRSVDQIGVVFGADTTLIDGPQDSVVVQLDGSAPGLVYFLFDTP